MHFFPMSNYSAIGFFQHNHNYFPNYYRNIYFMKMVKRNK